MLLETLNTARDLARLHEIAAVLIRHGFGDAVGRLGVARLLERAGRAVHWKRIEGLEKETHERVRSALEELGPTFVKLGQILAGRSDLLPPAWTEELSQLNERARPVAFEVLREQLAEDLGAPPEEVFRDVDPAPLAAASIAQVHRATLKDGVRVVLKIRRPGIRRTVEADLRLLARLADRAQERMPELRRFQLPGLVRQFKRSLRCELDLRTEAKNAMRIRGNLADRFDIVVPRVYPTWTCERLCVMDYLEGPSLGAWLRSDDSNRLERVRIARRGAEAVLHMVFVDGCFHADPHPGNVIRLADGRLGLVDFGMIGFLSDVRRQELLRLLMAVATRSVDGVVDTLLGWCRDGVDVDLLAQDSSAFIERYYGLPLKELDTAEYLGDLTALLRENDLVLPSDVALLLKVLLTLDGLGRLLDPEFDMASEIDPFARAAWREHLRPSRIAKRTARELGALAQGLPRDLRDLLLRVRRGRFHLEIEMQRLDAFARKLERSANRVTVGLVTAALIVGTAISLTVTGGPTVLGLPAFGLLGFGSSIALGFGLLWSILRSGRR